MAWERVYTTNDYYDGPRLGVADVEGASYIFQSPFDEALGDYAEYSLVGNRHSKRGEASTVTHPALSAERERHEEIVRLIDSAYRLTAEQEVADIARAEFSFVTSCAEYRDASALLQIALWPEGDLHKFEEAIARLTALPTGQGRVWITDSKVTHAHDNVVAGNGAIEWMKFSVEIKLPRPVSEK